MLEWLANLIARELKLPYLITVKELTKRVDPKEDCYALWDGNTHTIWLRLNNPNGHRYTTRHLITCIVHELAHATHPQHGAAFRREQLRIARIARKLLHARTLR